jgi:branched-chain amino acid aminotransferase
LCKENSIPVYEKNFLLENVSTANEAFVTGTFAGVIPVASLNGKFISDGKRGEMTKTLFNLYKEKINSLYPQ